MRLAQGLLRRGNLIRWTAKQGARPWTMAPLAETAMGNSSQQFSFAAPSSSAIRHFSKESQTNLVDILAREEKEEVDSGNTEMPEELVDLKSKLENDWRIVDDGATTQLFLKEKKIQISFHCQDTVEEEEVAYEEEEGEDEDDEPVAPVRFTVTISKAGKTLVINCLSELGIAKIDGVASTTSAPDVVHANQGVLEKAEYQGPDFLELAEDLQDAMAAFLEDECDVNSDVATFVAMYSDYKEQMQYAQFLKDAQSIIS